MCLDQPPGHGLIGPSTYLSPYQVLLLGQHDTLVMLEQEMHEFLPEGVTLRRRPNHWPPLHTPLVWERNIPNRTAMAMHHIGGGDRKPTPTIVSCTTGSSQLRRMEQPCDPGRLDRPSPAVMGRHGERPGVRGRNRASRRSRAQACSRRASTGLSHRIMKQLKMRHLDRLGSSVIPSISRNSWLTRKLPANAVLLRAPFLNHIILEDWLLAQEVS